MIVAFDVDGTLIDKNNQPKYSTILGYLWFKEMGNRMIIWSASKDWAANWNEKLGLKADIVASKIEAKDLNADICFDDEFVELAKVNYKI